MSSSNEALSSDPAAGTAAAATATAAATTVTPDTASKIAAAPDLPEKRFELELEFVQALASPAYLHFLATSRVDDSSGGLLLQDPAFQSYLKYLFQTWTNPDYSRYLSYPHCLYFLQLLIDKPAVLKEWTLPAFRNFCHQQQFMSWQHRHEVLYGKGSSDEIITDSGTGIGTADTATNTNMNAAEAMTALEQDGTAVVAMDTDSTAPDRS
jgi:mediator of RNA polymerase II transcription subunit 31